MNRAAAASLVPGAWTRASSRERIAMGVGAAVVLGTLAWAFALQPLTRDLDRLRDAAPAVAASLAQARALADDIAGLARNTPPARGDLRAAVERAFAERDLRAPAVTIEPQGDRVSVVVLAAPFATLVAALDAAGKDGAAFVVEGTITPRVEPGAVRAELVLAR
ncbi:MAG: type II secretion system protein GspM [Betaproteobacteria bacterium]